MSLFGIQSRFKTTTLMFSLLRALLFICSDQLRAITQLSYLSRNHQRAKRPSYSYYSINVSVFYYLFDLKHQPKWMQKWDVILKSRCTPVCDFKLMQTFFSSLSLSLSKSLFNSTMHLSRSSRMWQNSFRDSCLEYKAASIKTPLCEAKKQMHLCWDVAINCPQCTWEFLAWTVYFVQNGIANIQQLILIWTFNSCIIDLLYPCNIVLSNCPSSKPFLSSHTPTQSLEWVGGWELISMHTWTQHVMDTCALDLHRGDVLKQVREAVSGIPVAHGVL